MTDLNEAALNLIKSSEGLRLTVYNDVNGLPTVGWGHLIKDGESFDTITEEQADSLLQEDLSAAEQAVDSLVDVYLNANQFGALVSFTYNLGVGSLEKSTLLKFLNAGDYENAAAQFLRWCHDSSGKVVDGLYKRRMAEMQLFKAAV